MFFYSKKFRLIYSKDFNHVLNRPIWKKNDKGLFIISRINSHCFPRLGLMISKKNVKKAHQRNTIKRLIREYFRLNYYRFQKMDFIVLVKIRFKIFDKKTFLKELRNLWKYYHLS
ncbi:MAG: ribonuclease P protein component [Arsenophonus sp.]|nr:MAG: ribonuclease P protein component [Arsenophonus sp.]